MTSTGTSPLQITINGQARPAAAGSHLSDLVAELKLDPRQVAIERNRAIVPRSEYAATALAPGDAIEIVGFNGGG
ncbi:MAG: sulfur carrier protein ThiS [Alphaproteobacteria bacterium]